MIARLQAGRDGKVIGRTDEGLVVLFSQPPSLEVKTVVLTAYQERFSPNTGKKYIKCFSWMTEEDYFILNLSRTLNVDQTQLKRCLQLYDAAGEEAFASSLLKLTGADVVLVQFNKFLILPHRTVFSLASKSIGKLEDYYFLPNKCYSDRFTMVVLDDAFEYFEALSVSKHFHYSFVSQAPSGSDADLIVLLPKNSGVLDKLIATKMTKIPKFIKKRIYLELLNITSGEVELNDAF
ncbi:MAG: hypothetical protein QW223_08065 [Candidatus Caldarchaeum sp.]